MLYLVFSFVGIGIHSRTLRICLRISDWDYREWALNFSSWVRKDSKNVEERLFNGGKK